MPRIPVDVATEVVIDRPGPEVAACVSDQDSATKWFEDIESVRWETPPPAVLGSRVAFVSRFLGRRLPHTYEVRDLQPGESAGFATVLAPLIATAMRRANRKDLRRLKAVLEQRGNRLRMSPGG